MSLVVMMGVRDHRKFELIKLNNHITAFIFFENMNFTVLNQYKQLLTAKMSEADACCLRCTHALK